LHWRHAQRQPTRNTAEKRARQEDVDSDYLFDNSTFLGLKHAIIGLTGQSPPGCGEEIRTGSQRGELKQAHQILSALLDEYEAPPIPWLR
jgi:hypothetical protein